MVSRGSSATKLDRVQIALILALFYCLIPLTDDRGRKPEYPEKKIPANQLKKCHILKPENSSPNPDSNLHSSIGGRLGKQTC